MDPNDYLVLAEDLLEFQDGDVLAGLDAIGTRQRREGETAFPDLGTMREAIGYARKERRRREREHNEAVELEALKARWTRERDEDIANGIPRAPKPSDSIADELKT